MRNVTASISGAVDNGSFGSAPTLRYTGTWGTLVRGVHWYVGYTGTWGTLARGVHWYTWGTLARGVHWHVGYTGTWGTLTREIQRIINRSIEYNVVIDII